MLTRSNKSRLAAMALMALGVTTLMGTSAALATDVDVSGSVGCTDTNASLSGVSVPSLGTIARDNTATQNISYTLVQGTTTGCALKTGAAITAAMADGLGGTKAPTGQASFVITDSSVRVGVSVLAGPFTGASIPVTATVPEFAEGGDFGATVILTLTTGS
jgi:hypothetical protein